MERGTYVAASGGAFQLRKLEIVNNNLANANTVGFKKQILTEQTQTFDQTLAKLVTKSDPFARGDHLRSPGTVNVQTSTDFTPGAIQATGNPLDVALRQPNDFFVLEGASGTEYTRAGNFTLNDAGEIVTQDGARVQGDGGAITVSSGTPSISPSGIITVRGQQVGKLQVARFSDPHSLERVAGTRFKLAQNANVSAETVDADVVPSSLEMANVSAIGSVVDLISTQRAFEMYTKAAQSIDSLNQAAIGQVGRRN